MNARYCAWCGTVIPAPGESADAPGRLSHGICAECLVDTGEFAVIDLPRSGNRYPPLGVLRVAGDETVAEYRTDPGTELPTPRPDAYVGLHLSELARLFQLQPRRLAVPAGEDRVQEFIFRYPGGAALVEVESFPRPAEAATYLVWRMVQ